MLMQLILLYLQKYMYLTEKKGKAIGHNLCADTKSFDLYICIKSKTCK